MSDRCRWVRESGQRFHIPGCWGGAIYGPDGCYCPKSVRGKSRNDESSDLLGAIERLENRVAELEKRASVAEPTLQANCNL